MLTNEESSDLIQIKWNINHAKLAMFTLETEKSTQGLTKPEDSNNINELVNNFTEMIIKAAKNTVPIVKVSGKRTPNP